ncbi:pro-MCH [Melanotaenia boesemani]|uniref:pro-MCH n=1 Tax=Melanotaenia boesemani TaxID=1250792 RepID=UPI001C04BF73|nr:pro-MCH [Melanotaenia boesemani]
MISTYSILFTLVLCSELNSHLVTVAMPSAKIEDDTTDQEGFDSIVGEESMTEPAVVPPVYRRSFTLDNNMRDDGTPKIVILLSDTRLKAQRAHGLNSVLTRRHPLLTDRSLSHTLGEPNSKIDRRNTDLDMLRCMIGRVYRPCWEA